MSADHQEGTDPLLGQVLDGKYRIDTRLGRGGMGTVYRATHVLMEHPCAVKVLHTNQLSDPSSIPRFQREARAAARIQHPNAIAVNDFGITDANVVYLVMEYFPGKSLREVLRETGAIGPERTAKIIEKVGSALGLAHRQGVIHRDIKPDNIMIREVPGEDDEVKVLDFGIAKIVDSAPGSENLTITGTIIGTPHYLSPEQCRALADIDARSDIYSLAVVTYEMLAGTPPFSAPTPIAVAMMHLSDPIPSLIDQVPDLNPNVEAVIFKAMAKSRQDRYDTCTAFARDFYNAVHGLETGPLTDFLGGGRLTSLMDQSPPTNVLPDTGQRRAPDTVAVNPNATPAGGFSVDTGQHPAKGNTGFDPTVIMNQSSGASPADLATVVGVPQPIAAPQTEIVRPAEIPKPTPKPIALYALLGVIAFALIAVVVYLVLPKPVTPPVAPVTSTQKPPPANDGPPPGMVLIPGGIFTMGRTSADPYEGPPHEVTIQPFYMDEMEVTNKQYEEFVKATNYRLPSYWEGGTYPIGTADLPVSNVTWADARAYAQWAKKRLPTEAEWEYAARGTDERLYPWGPEWTPGLAYTKESGLTKLQPTGSSPKGASPFGVLDMSGNVWEWCEDNFSPYPGSTAPPKDLTFKIIRGGSLGDTREKAMTTYRNWVPPEREYEALGFRCVQSVE